jgi:hypothetical protein
MTMRAARLLRNLVFSLGVFAMATLQASGTQPAKPMRGPNFVMDKVAAWTDPQLQLQDGSRWTLDRQRPDYPVHAQFVAEAVRKGQELLVSGDRSSGVVDRLAPARRLAAQRVEMQADGRASVFFHGPPSIYYLRMDRPGAAQSLDLLRRSAAGGGFIDRPDLLVGIDTVSSEIILVQPLAGAPANTR